MINTIFFANYFGNLIKKQDMKYQLVISIKIHVEKK